MGPVEGSEQSATKTVGRGMQDGSWESEPGVGGEFSGHWAGWRSSATGDVRREHQNNRRRRKCSDKEQLYTKPLHQSCSEL